MLPFQLKALNEQIALLSEYKVIADSVVRKQEVVIQSLEGSVTDLLSAMQLKDQVIQNNDIIVQNMDDIIRNNKKKSLRTTIYTGIGCVGLGGVLTFILMR